MKLSVDAAVLKSVIANADSLAIKNSTVHSDRYIRLTALKDSLEVCVSNQAYTLKYVIPEVDVESAGTVCVEHLAPFIKELSDSVDKVSLYIGADSKLHVKRGRKTGKIPTIPSANFVERVSSEVPVTVFTAKKVELYNVIQSSLIVNPDSCKNLNLKALHISSNLGGNVVTAYCGNGVTMMKSILGTSTNSFELDIPLQAIPKIKIFLSLGLLAKDSAVEISKAENFVMFVTSYGSLRVQTAFVKYPNVDSLFNLARYEELDISVSDLSKHFNAAEGLFNLYSNVICHVYSTGNSIIVQNSVKEFEYEGELDNPSEVDVDFYSYTEAMSVGCSFVKDGAKFMVRRQNNVVLAIGITSETNTFLTVPVIKEKVAA